MNTLTCWLTVWIGYLAGWHCINWNIEWGIGNYSILQAYVSIVLLQMHLLIVRPIKYRYCTNHIWIHMPYSFIYCTYLIFYPCCNCLHSHNVQCTFTNCCDIMSIGCVMKTCKLFVVQIQNCFDYICVIFRSFYFVQNEGKECKHLNSMKMPMRYGHC